jgi:hypothetical protein
MATIREYYERGFPYAVGVDVALAAQGLGYAREFNARVHLDFGAHASFASVLLPPLPIEEIEPIVQALLRDSKSLVRLEGSSNLTLPRGLPSMAGTKMLVVREGNLIHVSQHTLDGPVVNDHDLMFTGRIYIYSQQDIDQSVQERLRTFALEQNMTVSFRGPAYAAQVDKMLKPIAFISHDSRDKDEIARPLAQGLQQLGVPVWYDEYSLHVGDSLRESIEAGLRATRFCILVLTPNFLSKGGWPKREYDTAFTRELIENVHLFLPVWHEVTKQDVFEYSPILADRVGVPWSDGVEQVCRKLCGTIQRESGDA